MILLPEKTLIRSSIALARPGLLVLCVIVAGCAGPTDPDPRSGGFIGGLQGLSSGTYEKRIAKLEMELARLDTANAKSRAELRDIERKRAEIERQLQELRREGRA